MTYPSILANLEIKFVKLLVTVSYRTEESSEFVALKILTAEAYSAEKDIFEREILKHLKEGGPGETGYEHICHLLDDFEHEGPNGKHVCLVFELMGETLRSFGIWFFEYEYRIPEHVMRRFAIQLIVALHYAHRHNVIHTGMSLIVKIYVICFYCSMAIFPTYSII